MKILCGREEKKMAFQLFCGFDFTLLLWVGQSYSGIPYIIFSRLRTRVGRVEPSQREEERLCLFLLCLSFPSFLISFGCTIYWSIIPKEQARSISGLCEWHENIFRSTEYTYYCEVASQGPLVNPRALLKLCLDESRDKLEGNSVTAMNLF